MARNDAAAARANERERINAIMSHEAAASKSNLARFLALETDHDVELCLGILAVAASEASARPSQQATPFASYMDASTHPNVGAGPGDVGFHDDVIGSLVNMGLVSHASADRSSAETVALARRMGLKGFAKED